MVQALQIKTRAALTGAMVRGNSIAVPPGFTCLLTKTGLIRSIPVKDPGPGIGGQPSRSSSAENIFRAVSAGRSRVIFNRATGRAHTIP